ncbi:WXG100 family type VII secretion target [Streptomyces sp. AJS327]|uniref:WXG100 family type VII secretion target n=1 Tax=Streptomyces sp. AJS327 TaxID=2545265 RepID=UPI0015DDB954|nr:WXG100 family type VII secretion target [Streptomyces sp. AJS327]MBA0051884.1 WXG100 family type VII secretion target [Streptomyces sp. AJS327]
MSSIDITYGTVEAAARDIRSAASTLRGQLEELHGEVTKVVNSWEGEAKVAYQRRQMNWNEDVRALHTTLNSLASLVESSVSNYRGTDRRGAQQFEI